MTASVLRVGRFSFFDNPVAHVHQTLASVPVVQVFSAESRTSRRYRELAAAAVSLMNAARTVIGPFASIGPLAEALLAAIAAAVLTITMFVVGRDLRSGGVTKEQA